MSKKKEGSGKINVSTQQYLDIAEIKKDTLVMKDGTVRAILLVSSINFALKDEEEQKAIISAYVSFLNNLDFPVQIVIQSREFNIEKYINDLKQKEKEQTNELLKMQTKEYIQYVQELISMGNIMKKKFYISIPYNSLSDEHKNFFQSLTEALRPSSLVKLKEEKFNRYKSELDRRVDSVVSGLASANLSSARLDTQGLIELFYNSYNPQTSENQRLTDVNNLRIAG
jgi:hypothetical protein